MYTHVNKVDIATNPDNKEVMLSFKQVFPVFKDEEPEEGKPKVSATPTAVEVANLIMTEDFAETLKELLNNML